MSIDPPFTAEFANAGFLAEIPEDAAGQARASSPSRARRTPPPGTDQLVVAPFWSNTQVLWYRKSFVEKAGLDMSQPVTWDQIIDAAADNGGKVGVQANKYEGYSVWINALIAGAGGDDRHRHREGRRRHRSTIDSHAGRGRGGIIEKLAGSEAAPADLSVSNEGTARRARSAATQGAFMVNWTYIWTQLRRDRSPT